MRFESPGKAPRWMQKVLWAAGLYNVAFGAWAVLLPGALFSLLNLPPPSPIIYWQCLGMVIGVYGVGYICAAFAPLRHWPIVLVGLLGKLLGPIGFYYAVLREGFPWRFGYVVGLNDIIWWLPFVLILGRAWGRAHSKSHRWFD